MLAYVLEPAAENAGEYKDAQGNLYIVGRTDVVYGGQLIGSLSRDQYLKAYTYNAPIIAVKNMNKYIITATHGELSEKYDDISAAHTRQSIIAVKKGDAWGCIDMAGNTVIPFEMRNAPSISADGTLVHCRTTGSEYRLYRLEASAPAVAADRLTSVVQSGEDVDDTPVLAPGAWQCACGFITNGNFCPGCGSARPAEEAPADDGSWDCACGAHNTSRFCPECGSAKPEAPAAEPQCSGCGYKPEGDAPKFCPECGTKF